MLRWGRWGSVNEVQVVYDREIVWIYFNLLENRPGLPISQEDMGYNLHVLEEALRKTNQMDRPEWHDTIIVRASTIAFEIIERKPFPKLNTTIGLKTGLLFLDKNGFRIKDDPPNVTGLTRKRIENWLRQISIPPEEQ